MPGNTNPRTAASPLEYAVLCLLTGPPRSAYELVKTFREWPFGGSGRSPGAVYPALRRLEGRGWVLGASVPVGRRPRTEYRLSAAGRAVLRTWATAEVTEEDLLESPGTLMLRFSFLTRVAGNDAMPGFLRQMEDVADALQTRLAGYRDAARPHAAAASRLALDLQADLLAAQAAWARRARAAWEEDAGAGSGGEGHLQPPD